MKKGAILFGVLFLIMTFSMVGILASEESEKVDKAFACLEEKIDDKECSTLSIEEKIFSLLSTGKCKTELLEDSEKNSEGDAICWSSSAGSTCNSEMTSKAALALERVGVDTELIVEWLWEQKGISTDLRWYLEIDSNRPLLCSIGYEAGSGYEEHEFEIDIDKKIDSNAGSCLIRTNSDFWFSINEDCYESEFQISCNESFISTLLYREKDSQTYHISDNVHSSSGGITIEKIDSFCLLGIGENCDYLGTLWGAFVLNHLEENVSSFFPYLITSVQSNQKHLPESFLYILMNRLEYKTSLLNKQILNKYWQVSGGRGRYYDTALALLPFQGESLTQKDNTKTWLFNVQQENGCWDNNNIVTNGFLLYSIWTEDTTIDPLPGDTLCSEIPGYECVNDSSECSGTIKNQFLCSGSNVCCDPSGGNGGNDCEENGYTCGSLASCTGDILTGYDCPGVKKCCDSKQEEETCSELNGDICSNNEYCSGGIELLTDDLIYGEICCVEGTCKVSGSGLDCETNLGVCAPSCESGYEESSNYDCTSSLDVCCVESRVDPNGGGSYWWIWVLLLLVILTAVAILYKDKIKIFIQKMKSRKRGGPRGSLPPRGMPPRFPPSYNRTTRIGPPVQRKIPPRPALPMRAPIRKKSPKELEDVLKKLKEIGK